MRISLLPVTLLALLTAAAHVRGAGSQPQRTSSTPAPGPEPDAVSRLVDRITARENELVKNLRNYRPRVETYIQDFRPDQELGDVPTNDHYFLGRLDFEGSIDDRSFLPERHRGRRVLSDIANQVTRLYSLQYQSRAFAYTIVMDTGRFDRQHYRFDFVRRDFLGDVRCLVFDVTPQPGSGTGLFEGRIWVEDQDDQIVRFNGTYASHSKFTYYFHFDSWRANLQPGLWLPVYVYSEESDLKYAFVRTLRFKSQTRLWGYDLTSSARQQELTRILVDAPASVQDASGAGGSLSPVASQRQMETEAENNVLDRLEKAGLLAPAGKVDQVLETVVNNLEVTNHLENLPTVHCRVLLTAPLESTTIGGAIVLSRGLLDVLPDEASLAMMLAHELAHILLGHNLDLLDTKYAFSDRMLIPDEELLSRLSFKRDQREEEDADRKALELLINSPYKEKLPSAGLFLKALSAEAPRTPNLLGAHLGTRLLEASRMPRMAELMSGAPDLRPSRLDQIAALPLGARVVIDSWSDQVTLAKTGDLALASPREKKPFEITPLYPYLVRLGDPKHDVSLNLPQSN
ncbi:MAG TPA: M48 family metalloprotease [Terriglobia bacterium]|nr:M48 family metalloprotease [Terriglobia bacterium]